MLFDILYKMNNALIFKNSIVRNVSIQFFSLPLQQLSQPKGFRGESQIVAKGRYETLSLGLQTSQT